MRVNCLSQEHHTVPKPGLEHGPVAPGMGALTMWQPHLPVWAWWKEIIILYLNQKSPHSLEINSKYTVMFKELSNSKLHDLEAILEA